MRGITRFHSEKSKESLDDLETAVQFAPESSFAHSYRGVVLGQLGRANAAMEQLRRAIELEPQCDAFLCRAEARLANGDLDGALQDVTEAIRTGAEEPTASVIRTVIYLKMQKLDEAEADAGTVLRAMPIIGAAEAFQFRCPSEDKAAAGCHLARLNMRSRQRETNRISV